MYYFILILKVCDWLFNLLFDKESFYDYNSCIFVHTLLSVDNGLREILVYGG